MIVGCRLIAEEMKGQDLSSRAISQASKISVRVHSTGAP